MHLLCPGTLPQKAHLVAEPPQHWTPPPLVTPQLAQKKGATFLGQVPDLASLCPLPCMHS